jgi:hypothetical protein
MTITNWREISSKNFNIFKPIKLNNHYKTVFKYKKQPLTIQTPKTFICNSPKEFNNTTKISICFYDYAHNSLTKLFIKQLSSIELFIKKAKVKLNKFLENSYIQSEFKTSIKYNNNNTVVYMDLLIDKNQLSVYNLYKQSENMDYMIPQSYLLNIIQLDYIWFNKNKYGIKWTLLQTKVFPPINKLDKCIIDDIYDNEPHRHYYDASNIAIYSDKENNRENNKEDNPVFGKYFKMKRMGIPDDRIYLKIQLDGLSIKDFKDFELGINTKTTVNTAINTTLNTNLTNIKSHLSVTKYPIKEKYKTSNGFAPSEKELILIRQRLKKIKDISRPRDS